MIPTFNCSLLKQITTKKWQNVKIRVFLKCHFGRCTSVTSLKLCLYERFEPCKLKLMSKRIKYGKMWTFGDMIRALISSSKSNFFQDGQCIVICSMNRTGLSIPETCHQVFHPQKITFDVESVFRIAVQLNWTLHGMEQPKYQIVPILGYNKRKIDIYSTPKFTIWSRNLVIFWYKQCHEDLPRNIFYYG